MDPVDGTVGKLIGSLVSGGNEKYVIEKVEDLIVWRELETNGSRESKTRNGARSAVLQFLVVSHECFPPCA